MKRTRNPRANKVKDFRNRGYDCRGRKFFHHKDRVRDRRAAAIAARAEAAEYMASKEA